MALMQGICRFMKLLNPDGVTSGRSGLLLAGRPRGGFTLIELLVVVLIITVLATFVGVQLFREPHKARIAAVTAQMKAFETALRMYRMDNGMIPTQEQGLDALCASPQRPPVPRGYPAGGYLEKPVLPRDPWGNDYVYLSPGRNGEPFEILSYGLDGEPGGEGEASDISSSDI